MLLRPAEPADALAVAAVHVASWQAAYRGLLPDAYLDALRPEDRASRYTFGRLDPTRPATIVAVDDAGAITGFATTSPSRDGDRPGVGELCSLYAHPDHWGCGVGRELIASARARLVDDGFVAADLWLLVGNRRAARFYELDGWAPDGTRRTDRVWGLTVDEVRYCRKLG